MVMSAAIHEQECDSSKGFEESCFNKTKYKTLNLLQTTKGTVENNSIDKKQNLKFEQSYTCDQEFCDSHSKRHHIYHHCSELLPLKKSDFKSNIPVIEKNSGNWNTLVTNHRRKFESGKPAPILYFGHDVEAERLWNEKMKNAGECVMPQTDSEHCNWEKPEIAAHHKQQSIQIENKIKRCHVETIHPKSLISVKDSSVVIHHKAKVKQKKPFTYPRGWLRTTPIVILKQCNHVPCPKLSRTSLLRRAKLDSQLAHQLHTEVEYQMKQRLKHLDESFRDEMIKSRRRKFVKAHACSMLSVGCQTIEVGCGYVQNAEDISLKYSSHDLVNPVHRGEHHNEIEQHFRHESQEMAKDYLEKNNGVIKNGKEKISEFNKNLSCDIDVTEFYSCIKNDPTENYEEDFEMSTDSQSSSVFNTMEKQNILNKYDSRIEISVDRQRTSPSLSVPVSLIEPKLQSKEQKPNKIRDIKLKEIYSKSGIYIGSESIVRDPTQDKGLTYTVHKELPQEDKKIEVTTVESHQHITCKNVQYSPKNVNTSYIVTNDLKFDVDTHCSQVSEVSDTLDLSAEVFKEVLKGRHVDLFMRNDSQINDSKKELLVTEESDICDESVPVCVKNIAESAENSISVGNLSLFESVAENYIESSRKCSMTDIIGKKICGEKIPISCNGVGLVDNSTIKIKESKVMLKKYQMNNDTLNHGKRAMLPDFLEKLAKDVPSNEKSLNSENCNESRGSSPRGLDDIDSSISNISARIAALLMPRRVSLAKFNTDSVSSYVPSGATDTLSSLSDMMED